MSKIDLRRGEGRVYFDETEALWRWTPPVDSSCTPLSAEHLGTLLGAIDAERVRAAVEGMIG